MVSAIIDQDLSFEWLQTSPKQKPRLAAGFGVGEERPTAATQSSLRRGFSPRRRAARDGVDARHQLVLMEWLGHVVVGAEAETSDLVLGAGEAGEDQDRRLYLGDAQRT